MKWFSAWWKQWRLDRRVARMTPEERKELERRLLLEFTRRHVTLHLVEQVNKDIRFPVRVNK